MWRSRPFWAALLAIWGVALLLPRPVRQGPGKPNPRWPPKSFVVYYGRWDHAKIAKAWGYDLIIAHPGRKLEGFNRDLVERLRNGANGQNHILLAYLSLGEDEDPPVGPVPMAPRYLDEVSYRLEKGFPARDLDGLPVVSPGHDGIPDRNGAWGSYYVHPGDPEWRTMVLARADRLAERGVDGFFLDTVDVRPALRADMMGLIEQLRQRFPRLYLVSNRGVDLVQKFPERSLACLDGVVLESWFTQWNWSWGRATLSPYWAENQRLLSKVLQPHPSLCKLFLDYLDPEQPDRGPLLARRREFGPAFWSHPFLNRLDNLPPCPPQGLEAPQSLSARRTPEGLVEVTVAGDCEALAVTAAGVEVPLPHLRGPWAVGAAQSLRLRRVDQQGRISASVEVAVPPAAPAFDTEWIVLELEHSLQVRWEGGEPAQLWLGAEPGQIRPVPVSGPSPLLAQGLKLDQLYWISLSRPGGPPEVARPARTHDVTPPPRPARVRARYHGGFLTVSWTEVEASDLAGYRIYVTRPGAPLALPYQVGPQANFEVALPDLAYKILVTSFDTGNHESLPTAP
ncbi:endo alpha-1,4 polygalactosaminidase [bacterium]|nr:endo alpha-1,4 polygalactosaminidase [bacterium]